MLHFLKWSFSNKAKDRRVGRKVRRKAYWTQRKQMQSQKENQTNIKKEKVLDTIRELKRN